MFQRREVTEAKKIHIHLFIARNPIFLSLHANVKEIYLYRAYLYPKIINFDAMDFSEWSQFIFLYKIHKLCLYRVAQKSRNGILVRHIKI